jgi:hypothetical protein
MTNLAKKEFCPAAEPARSFRSNWFFEVEPYSRTTGESLGDLRDNLRIKKALRQAVWKDFAPQSLIDSTRIGLRR